MIEKWKEQNKMKGIITIAMLISALFSSTKEKNANILKYGIYADASQIGRASCRERV